MSKHTSPRSNAPSRPSNVTDNPLAPSPFLAPTKRRIDELVGRRDERRAHPSAGSCRSAGDLVPGGRFQLEGNAGGTITVACEPLSHIALTWEFGGDVSWVDVRFSDEGAGRARLTLTHTSLHSNHWEEYGPGASGVGWELGLMGLALHLPDPTAAKPDEVAFAASSDGKAIITGSSEAWGQAAVADGTDPDAADTAARRTTAFYTGEPAEPD